MASDVLLIQFAKSPEPGKVKTRLLGALTPHEAAEVHVDLLRHTARMLVAADLGPVQLATAGPASHPVFHRCIECGVAELVQQRGSDLGERMLAAITDGLVDYQRVILVGSDCPSMDAAYLRDAVIALDTTPVVLGAATDGGFVLIGAREIVPDAFSGVEWGSASVLAQTQANLAQLGISCTTLDALRDVDRPEDLAHWEAIKVGR